MTEHQRRGFSIHERDGRPGPCPVPAAACHDGVHVRVPRELVAERLHHGDHARDQCLLRGQGRTDHVAGGLVRRLAEPAEQRPVVEKVRPPHLRDGKHPLRMANIGEDLVAQERCGRGRALGGAGGAQAAALAGEGDEELGPAGATPHAREAVLQDAAVEVRADRSVREPPPEAVMALEALLPLVVHVGVVRLDEPLQGRRLGDTRTVERTGGSGHGSLPIRGVDRCSQAPTRKPGPST
jgi:hypothetical protein